MMNTHISRSDTRLKLLSTEEAHKAVNLDAVQLMAALSGLEEGYNPAELLNCALGEILALAAEHRFEECDARRAGFCEAFGPVLERAAALEAKCALLSASLNQADKVAQTSTAEQRAVDAAILTCSQVSAGRIIAAHPNDDEAIVTLCELQLAVRALEPKSTETEGGKL